MSIKNFKSGPAGLLLALLLLALIFILPGILSAQGVPTISPTAKAAETSGDTVALPPNVKTKDTPPAEPETAKATPPAKPGAAKATPPAEPETAKATPPAKPGAAKTPEDEVHKSMRSASVAYEKEDYIGALDSLWAAQEAVWGKSPLGLRNVAFVTGQPENFGTYQPKVGEDFKNPEPLILYSEPIGFTQLKTGDTYRYSLIGAFDVLDAKGKVLGGQKNLGPYEQRNYRTFSTETMLTMTIGIQGLPPGSYTLRVTFTDNLDLTKSVQLEKPFNIVE